MEARDKEKLLEQLKRMETPGLRELRQALDPSEEFDAEVIQLINKQLLSRRKKGKKT